MIYIENIKVKEKLKESIIMIISELILKTLKTSYFLEVERLRYT